MGLGHKTKVLFEFMVLYCVCAIACRYQFDNSYFLDTDFTDLDKFSISLVNYIFNGKIINLIATNK